MSRERILGAIEALEEIRAHRSWPQLGVTVVLCKLETLRAQLSALPPEPAHGWTSREWKMREAISKAWTAQTFHEAQDALRPIIQDDECTRTDGMPDPRDEALEVAEKAIWALLPSHRAPGCWCPRGQDIENFGHSGKCTIANEAVNLLAAAIARAKGGTRE